MADHFPDQFREACARLPAQFAPRLAGVADQLIQLARAEITRIDPDQRAPAVRIDAGLIQPLALPAYINAGAGERSRDEIPHAAGLAGRQHIVAGLVPLQHQP